jgi:hypothetical protein
MAHIARSGEVQVTPLGLVMFFSEDLLDLTPDAPRLQFLAGASNLLIGQVPIYQAVPLAADPLSVDIDVDVDVKPSFYVYA